MQKHLSTLGIRLESWAPFAQGRYNLLSNELLKTISTKHQKTVAQIVLRCLVQKMVIAIPRSVNSKRAGENFEIFNFALSADEMLAIQSLDKGNGLIYRV